MQRLVDRLRWMSEEVYGELFALAQFLPGPTSTQVSFSVGIIKKGTRGGLCHTLLPLYPAAPVPCFPCTHPTYVTHPAAAYVPCLTASPPLCHAGGLLSGALFQYPGAVIMAAVGVFAADSLVNPKGALGGVASGALVPGATCQYSTCIWLLFGYSMHTPLLQCQHTHTHMLTSTC